jgi:hypothetical protein
MAYRTATIPAVIRMNYRPTGEQLAILPSVSQVFTYPSPAVSTLFPALASIRQPPGPFPGDSSDPTRTDRTQGSSMLGDLDPSRLAASIDELWPAPLSNLAGGCLSVVDVEAESHCTL